MSTETREFHIGDILSVTSGRLVAPGHVGALYEDEHTHMDPITELRKLAPHAEIIPVVVPDAEAE